jgi:hypothetical protein
MKHSNNLSLWVVSVLGSLLCISQMTKKFKDSSIKNNMCINQMSKQSRPSVKKNHYIVDIDYLNDVACNIADNVPPEFYDKFLKELKEYMRCAITIRESSESSESESDSDLDEEIIEVETDENGFYSIAECDVRD